MGWLFNHTILMSPLGLLGAATFGWLARVLWERR